MKKLTKEGVGTETMQAQPLTQRNCGAYAFFAVYWLELRHAIPSFGTTANSLALEVKMSTDPYFVSSLNSTPISRGGFYDSEDRGSLSP